MEIAFLTTISGPTTSWGSSCRWFMVWKMFLKKIASFTLNLSFSYCHGYLDSGVFATVDLKMLVTP